MLYNLESVYSRPSQYRLPPNTTSIPMANTAAHFKSQIGFLESVYNLYFITGDSKPVESDTSSECEDYDEVTVCCCEVCPKVRAL